MALLMFNSLRGKLEDWSVFINAAYPELEIREWPEIGNPEDIDYLVIGRPSLQELPPLPNLKLMLTMLAGVEGIYNNPACPEGIPLVKGEPTSGDPSLTEYGVTHVLRHHRNLPTYQEQQRQHLWQPIEQISASERRVGMLGYGTMSKPIVDVLLGMNFDVAAWARTPKPDAPIDIFTGPEGFDDFLSRTDIAVCLLPFTPETNGILDAGVFAKMPKGASIINLGRGGHIVSDDLVAALDSGQLSSATLDVTEPEPLPEDSPLWDHPAITILPHVARRPPVGQIAPQFIENIRRFEAGEPLLQQTDKDLGY
ncbi:MAG: glyoxylate/hydroxypyruvate reductase A [Rhodospirillaceae bacterium]|jgi:glyoxylate/hydroxypyruvate reductase|nr:glyoxylate/hydroxypyruvate reductase A [Rhodospirillaceae bacterium]MBT4587742.1 glyoxylate/hydroxypyruvate reductase A [Rhodospirillaceae bacterium]MBT7266774.1 glyoxylate/hydroxypyruvate reductase A [Rhodospirillaceae bacterium]